MLPGIRAPQIFQGRMASGTCHRGSSAFSRRNASQSVECDSQFCAVRGCWGGFVSLTSILHSLQVSERLSQPGVAIGLAWTPLGGEIMFVEASRMDGEGQLTLTGQLGDIMKESAHLAISWLRSNAKKYHLTNGE